MCSVCATLGLNIHIDGAPEVIAPADFSLDSYVGGFYRGKEIFSLDGVIDQIDSGRALDVGTSGVITFGFFDFQHALGLNNSPGFGEGEGYTPFSEAQRDAAREAVAQWDDLISATFVEVTAESGASDWGQDTVDIWLANTSTGPAQAWAYYPDYGQQYTRVSSDVWVADPADNWTNNWFSPGGYGNTTLIHELGHAVGLSHPGAYNGAAATTYAGMAEYAQDSMQYSIMSYWSGANTGNSTVNWLQFLNNYAQTPMLHDILTAQAKYGADPTTRTGDTTYGFNSNADRDIFDFNTNGSPYLSIYDAGGNDTIDLSGYSASNFVNLQAGSFSSVGQAIPLLADINAARAALAAESGVNFGPMTQATVDSVSNSRMNLAEANIELETGVEGIRATQYDNLSIAYGVTIENAIGGSASDVLWGNEVSNELTGMAGDDVLQGFGGDDILSGGQGADTFVFANDGSTDTILDFQSRTDTIDLSALGVTRRDVKFDESTDTLLINTDGVAGYDMEIIVHGTDLNISQDILFG